MRWVFGLASLAALVGAVALAPEPEVIAAVTAGVVSLGRAVLRKGAGR